MTWTMTSKQATQWCIFEAYQNTAKPTVDQWLYCTEINCRLGWYNVAARPRCDTQWYCAIQRAEEAYFTISRVNATYVRCQIALSAYLTRRAKFNKSNWLSITRPTLWSGSGWLQARSKCSDDGDAGHRTSALHAGLNWWATSRNELLRNCRNS